MALEYRGGKGLWTEYVDSETNKSSIELHTPKTVATYCKHSEHTFKHENSHSSDVYCTKCGALTHYILGMQKLVDGKIVNVIPLRG